MPRFLNTWTGEFVWHADPRYITYAILSHVWRRPEDGGEQSYDDVRRIQASVRDGTRVAGVSPSMFSHPKLSKKLQYFCKVARSAGFRFVWNDACCIDKSSSAELSEAINSMYEWYRLSDMCYVYLADVPDDERPQDAESKFQESRWHWRGWTLQELIAPERVTFLTKNWRYLGMKMGLATTLERITGVDRDILTGRATLDSVSVARRMSWAAARVTTRIEDRAYSLLGIFGIQMSPIYGEGENAFLRLQEEILRKIPDHSIFVWGRNLTMRSLENYDNRDGFGQHKPGLLASSPAPFAYSRNVTPVTPSHLAKIMRLKGCDEIPPIHCILTPEGVRMRLLCFPLAGAPHVLEAFRTRRTQKLCAECVRLGEVDTLALLQCQDTDGNLVALPLYRSQQERGPSNHGIFIGTHGQCADERHLPARIVKISKEALAEVLDHVWPT